MPGSAGAGLFQSCSTDQETRDQRTAGPFEALWLWMATGGRLRPCDFTGWTVGQESIGNDSGNEEGLWGPCSPGFSR